MTKGIGTGLAGVVMLGVLAGCQAHMETEARAKAASDNAERAAQRAEAAAQRAEQATGRAEAAAQRAEAMVAKMEDAHQQHHRGRR